jgi:hypothetical protein
MSLTMAELEELEALVKARDSLPHINGFPWYRWAKDFFDSKNKACFLCAANQISKSSTQIRKAIEWATNPGLWKELWPNLLPGQKPNQFWYFYPTFDVAQTEFETKWEPDFLPRGDAKEHPVTGWKEYYDKGQIKKIEFNSGVTIYFKVYSQKIKDLQSGSVHAIFLDEECPVDFIPELQARLRAVDGYMNAVFTATIGQEFWRRVMEPKNPEEEIYPDAFKQTVSMYDCLEYIDGKKSRWTEARIKKIIQECSTDAEVQRRVFGRFVKSEGLKIQSFDIDRNSTPKKVLPKIWGNFAGVDPGSGGKAGHPAGIIFISVRPDYKYAEAFRAWRGDDIDTSNTDILKKFRELKGSMLTMGQVYDYKDKDFQLEAVSAGESFTMANKARDEGFGVLNSLFKNGMLKIQRGDPELEKLITEITSLSSTVDKRKAKDDLVDALRYACMAVPWDFSHIQGAVDTKKFDDEPPDERTAEQRANDELLQLRRDFALNKGPKVDDYDVELEYWNDMMGAGND